MIRRDFLSRLVSGLGVAIARVPETIPSVKKERNVPESIQYIEPPGPLKKVWIDGTEYKTDGVLEIYKRGIYDTGTEIQYLGHIPVTGARFSGRLFGKAWSPPIGAGPVPIEYITTTGVAYIGKVLLESIDYISPYPQVPLCAFVFTGPITITTLAAFP